MFAQAANCERLKDDFCGECATCLRISQLADPQELIEQGLVERGESADAATVERVPLILQSHPDVWALVPDPVRLKSRSRARCCASASCAPSSAPPTFSPWAAAAFSFSMARKPCAGMSPTFS